MDSGIYIAVFYMPAGRMIKIGRLGKFYFRRGIYFYTGSAQRSLPERLERHGRKKKLLHWHIDYLSVRARMLGAITISGRRELECEVAGELDKLFELAVPRFGASDCKCAGHLFYAQRLP